MANYYCLIAGLPEIDFSDSHPGYSMDELVEQLHESLTPWDARLMANFFFLQRDCKNLVGYLKDPEAELMYQGAYTKEQYHDLVKSAEEMNFNVHRYPSFLSIFAREWAFNKDKKGYFPEDEILYLFYKYAIDNCSNKFVREWYQMNMDINNILTAILARKYGWNIADYIKGEGEVQEKLREENTPDFGLSREMDYMKELIQIADQDDPVKKEKMIDALKWLWLDDNTFFEPFGIESVFAYMCKLEMQYRWANLDVEKGKESFEQIIENLRGEARVPDAYKV
ncbi:MAG: DUF2764 family protein [Bacteroidaceae bacterium]|nr:DUF2764 family protein [Bacteroidaceae bacterium]MBQ5393238.1 DUF2764 family protein [Bacteroidaceae bacterium]MBQ5839666.1 DUF2764 family protein [Bacteroidaceae bacterium]MBQ5912048.1 DUF2764 family protein [Bacteroidaceae bacterium]